MAPLDTRTVQLVVRAPFEPPPPLVVDLETGESTWEGSGTWNKTGPPPPVKRSPVLPGPRDLDVRRVAVDTHLPEVSAALNRVTRVAKECVFYEDLAIDGAYIVKAKADPEGAPWLLLGGTFLKQRLGPPQRCPNKRWFSFATVLGEGGRSASGWLAPEAPAPGGALWLLWALEPDTPLARIGLGGEPYEPAAILAVDIEQGLAHFEKRRPAPRARAERGVADFSADWQHRKDDPPLTFIRRVLRNSGESLPSSEAEQWRRFCERSWGRAGASPGIFGWPVEKVWQEECVKRNRARHHSPAGWQ